MTRARIILGVLLIGSIVAGGIFARATDPERGEAEVRTGAQTAESDAGEDAEHNHDRTDEDIREDQCLVCHQDLEEMPADFLEDNVHRRAGLGCAGCHGGDAASDDDEIAMSKAAGYIGVPERADIPRFCGRCHADADYMNTYKPGIPTRQLEEYYTSIHGQRLKKGDKKVAVCSSCHTAHGILSPKNPLSTVYATNVPHTCKRCHSDPERMKGYPIRTTQFREYKASVHGVALLERGDLGAPACNDCHGNHRVTPTGGSVTKMCGNCHVNNMRFFSNTKMAAEFKDQELHGCEACHGYHDIRKTNDDMVGTTDDAFCVDCHDTGEKGYEAATRIHNLLNSLLVAYNTADEQRKEIQRIGMDDVELGFMLQAAKQSLIHARTLVHTFDPEKVAPKVEEGMKRAQEAIELARLETRDHHHRHLGLGMATGFITLLVIGLFLKIRQIESD